MYMYLFSTLCNCFIDCYRCDTIYRNFSRSGKLLKGSNCYQYSNVVRIKILETQSPEWKSWIYYRFCG